MACKSDTSDRRRWGPRESVLVGWAVCGLGSLFLVTGWLESGFPIFAVIWLVVPLAAVMRSGNASRVGFRAVPWRELIPATAIAMVAQIGLAALVEPWSHTYQVLCRAALAQARPDATFAWLSRYPGLPGWLGMLLFSGLVTLFAEELFFRGWLLQWLLGRLKPAWAIAVQAALFSLPQMIASLLLPPLQGTLYAVAYSWLMVGVVCGWAAYRTRSIWPGLLAVTLLNAVLTACLL